jgi:hypothetical protein
MYGHVDVIIEFDQHKYAYAMLGCMPLNLNRRHMVFTCQTCEITIEGNMVCA